MHYELRGRSCEKREKATEDSDEVEFTATIPPLVTLTCQNDLNAFAPPFFQ